jgi:mRNA-degrading endonuclease RelE of RelBE toxin-antitoxin system/PHD/YefM family antitoxin component YafN of YafNO toxin-antitoxin module
MEKHLSILDLPEDARRLVGECELTGSRTIFERNEKPVAMLVSYDEYLALRETIDVANDAAIRAEIDASEAAVAKNALLLPEELNEQRMANDRIRLAEPVEAQWQALAEHEQAAIGEAFAVIDEDPIAGAPFFEPLRGLWSYRAGHLRLVYRIVAEARFVVVLFIGRSAA